MTFSPGHSLAMLVQMPGNSLASYNREPGYSLAYLAVRYLLTAVIVTQ